MALRALIESVQPHAAGYSGPYARPGLWAPSAVVASLPGPKHNRMSTFAFFFVISFLFIYPISLVHTKDEFGRAVPFLTRLAAVATLALLSACELSS